HNKLTGPIGQIQKPNSIRNIDLSSNDIHGPIPRLLPESLANCSSLKVLNLRNNKLTDTFPHWLTSLPYLQVLLLRNNKLYGPMPNSIASSNFSSLQIIDLSHNELTGPLPTKFFQNLRAMKDVPQKRHRGPSSLGYMHYPASSSQGYMPYQANGGKGYVSVYQQISMNVSVNVTMKRLEIELARTLDIFMSMDFSSNFFYGQIPKELGELISLQALNFSNNHLIGPIPTSFGNMVALESLDLSSNKLGGRIPSQLTNLTFLAVLNLSQNALTGPIPRGKQFDTFENDSYSGNLGLCGPPLSKQCGNDEEPKPPVPMPKEDEELKRYRRAVLIARVPMFYDIGVYLVTAWYFANYT
ncbi:Leucine-rich repeat - like 10, partial [Theobroma cacao]